MRDDAAKVLARGRENGASGARISLRLAVGWVQMTIRKDRKFQKFDPLGVTLIVGELDDLALCVLEVMRVTTCCLLAERGRVDITLGLILADLDIATRVLAGKDLGLHRLCVSHRRQKNIIA